ncbi:hypothetical protein ACWDKQ_07585 [Saccharopolyspora sp. NPDC000995]
MVERDVAPAYDLGDGIAEMPHLRLLAPVRFNAVCVTPTETPTAERVTALARTAAGSGVAFLAPTVYKGRPGLRAAFSNWRTTDADVVRVADVLRAA